MNSQPLISVLIPIYQVRAYLAQCLDSVIHQTYQNLEIILVDDGSTDGSGEICDQYAGRDARIKVIHKENGGLVSARKAGLQAASGELIAYVDSDDWIDPETYQAMYQMMEDNDADVVVAGHWEHSRDEEWPVNNFIAPGVYQSQDLTEKVFSRMLYEPSIGFWGLSPAVWDKLFKRNLVFDYQMRVDERIWDGEDHAFVYSAILDAKCVCISEKNFYHHRIREGSVAVAYDQKCFERFSYLFCHLKDQFSKSPYWSGVLEKQFPYQMRWFLWKHIRTELGIQAEMEYIFPFGKVEKGMRIALYGAGEVGRIFYHQIRMTGYGKIVAWVSKDHRTCRDREIVESPEKLLDIPCDVVVIAVQQKPVADSIRRDLLNMGIDEGKIVWQINM